MIYKYIGKKGNISPGIIYYCEKKLKDGSYLSTHPAEKEVKNIEVIFNFFFFIISSS